MRKRQLDGYQVGKAIALIKQQSQFLKREIPFRIVFSMTNTLNNREG
ncbi:hypothetical protein [Bartonella rattimassiliensis]|nr:hypothetical protein [Bartonella rattimassiliensis]